MAGGNSARDLGVPLVHYLRKTVALADFSNVPAGQLGVSLGAIPAGAFLGQLFARIDTPFNAGTTNVLTVGFDNNVTNMASAADITEGSAQTQVISTGAGLQPTVDSDIYVKYAQTGTPANAGQATFVVSFVPLRPSS